ncbi:MAG: antitoxin HigA [Actinomycetota bacterium]|nr:antitoxin HigA [Actinomycetota bacterium]
MLIRAVRTSSHLIDKNWCRFEGTQLTPSNATRYAFRVRDSHEPIHPGEILLDEFLNPMGITQYRLAQTIFVPARRINEIVHGKRAISPDTALRLSRALGTSDRFWMNLQSRYDLDIAVAQHHEEFDQIKPLMSA